MKEHHSEPASPDEPGHPGEKLSQLYERLAELQGRVEDLSRDNAELRSLFGCAGVASVDDVAELRRAQEALRLSEERYRSLVENAQIAIIVNRNNRIDYANGAAVRLFGAGQLDDVIGRSPYDFVHPEGHAVMTERIGTLCRGDRVPLAETSILRENGEERFVEVTAVSFVDAQGPAIQVMMHDVTERRLVAEALFKSQEHFRMLADAIPQLCWMADPDGMIFWFNRRCYEYTGSSTAQLKGWGWQSVIDPEVLPEVLKRWRASLATGSPFDMEFPLRGRDGSYRTFLTRVLPVTDAAGQVLRWFGTNTDISALDSLSREIAERKQTEKQLQEALEAARTANSMMTRSVRTIAHEFRTPLGLLTGSTDILDRYWERLTPEQRQEQNDQIRSASRQIATLVNSVTSFQLADTEENAHRPQLRNVGAISRAIAAEVEKVWGAGHSFVVSIAADCDDVLVDVVLFRRMLQNLLSNAFRYTLATGTVSLSLSREEGALLVEVTDSGIGIPEEDQPLIFDAFYRSRNVEDRRGLGLGLSIVRDALSQLGGTITVASALGKGTAVTVKLPSR